MTRLTYPVAVRSSASTLRIRIDAYVIDILASVCLLPQFLDYFINLLHLHSVETHESSGRKCEHVVYRKFQITAKSEFARGKHAEMYQLLPQKHCQVYSIIVNVTLTDDSIQELTSSTNKETCLPTSRFQQLLISLCEIWPYI
jgi:hypothetical protein